MKRSHILILAVVILADLAVLLWRYDPFWERRPATEPRPPISFRASLLPGPPATPNTSPTGEAHD